MLTPTARSRPVGKPTPRQLRYLRVLAEQTGTTFPLPKTFAQAKRLIDDMHQRKQTPRSDVQREHCTVSDEMATRRGDAAQVRADELSGYGSSATWTTDAGEEPGPRVVHSKRERYDVYVGRGRGSRWGNPFKSPRDGSRDEVIAKYERWLVRQPELVAALPELRGKVLACWCAPEPCHADVLLRLANAPIPIAPTPAIQAKGKAHALVGYRVGEERRLIVVQRIHGTIRVGDLPANGKGERYLIADRLTTYGELNELLLDYNGQIAKLGVIPASPAAIRQILERAA
jgi:hypothetical protein